MTMRKLLASCFVAILLTLPAVPVAARQCTNVRVSGSYQLINADLSLPRSFSVPGNSMVPFGEATVWVEFTDADSSITKMTMTCTGQHANSVAVYTLQSGSVTDGELVSLDASWSLGDGVTGSGSKNVPWRVNISMMETWGCSFAVASGSADAVIDTVAVYASACYSD